LLLRNTVEQRVPYCGWTILAGSSVPNSGSTPGAMSKRPSSAFSSAALSATVRQVQSGYLYHYAFAMIIGLSLLLGWLLLRS